MSFFSRLKPARNIGEKDRTIRIIAGVIVLLLVITDNIGLSGPLYQIPVGAIGCALLLTALARFSLFYYFTGRSTLDVLASDTVYDEKDYEDYQDYDGYEDYPYDEYQDDQDYSHYPDYADETDGSAPLTPNNHDGSRS